MIARPFLAPDILKSLQVMEWKAFVSSATQLSRQKHQQRYHSIKQELKQLQMMLAKA